MELNCSSLSSLSITNIARVNLTVLVLSLTSAFIIDDNMNVKMDSTLSCNAMKSNMDEFDDGWLMNDNNMTDKDY